jgi:ABC-type multidrug transport system fused ATPase/permease subunit
VSTALPVADVAGVRAYARRLLHRHPRRIAFAVSLYVAAAVSGLVAPRLLGNLVDDVQRGTTTATVDRIALLLAVFVLLQTVLTRWSHWVALVLAERMFAELREEFLERVVDLPLSTVESAGSGDLLTRMTADIDSLARTVRYAVPEVTVALLTTVLTVAAALLAGPQIAVAALVVVRPATCASARRTRRSPGR